MSTKKNKKKALIIICASIVLATISSRMLTTFIMNTNYDVIREVLNFLLIVFIGISLTILFCRILKVEMIWDKKRKEKN